MEKLLEKPGARLYESDFCAWTQQQADRIRARAHNEIDWENVAEEIESVGRGEKKELRSRLEVLLRHLFKWELQSERRKSGWYGTIAEQRAQIRYTIEDSPSLRGYPAAHVAEMYRIARMRAASEMGKNVSTIPAICPYDVENILHDEFLPGPSLDGAPDDLPVD